MRNNLVTVHPAVFTDQRHVDALQARTGRRIVIDIDGSAHLEQPPITRVSVIADLNERQRKAVARVESRMRATLNNLADFTAGHDPKGAA